MSDFVWTFLPKEINERRDELVINQLQIRDAANAIGAESEVVESAIIICGEKNFRQFFSTFHIHKFSLLPTHHLFLEKYSKIP
jgi:hypothetical protein